MSFTNYFNSFTVAHLNRKIFASYVVLNDDEDS